MGGHGTALGTALGNEHGTVHSTAHGATHDTPAAGSTVRHHEHGGMAGRDEGPSATPTLPDNPVHPATPHTCDCLAHCCATSLALKDAHAPAISIVVVTPDTWRATTQTGHTRAWVDYVLPFAMAPPVSVHT